MPAILFLEGRIVGMTQYTLGMDFETHSEADIKSIGARAYIQHPSTRVLCLAYHFVGDTHPPDVWMPGMLVPDIFQWVAENDVLFCGWNAMNFERLAWKYICVPLYGFPELRDDRWVDTMHLAAAANLPRSLDGASVAAGGPKKDKEGHKIMMELTQAKRTPRELLFDGEIIRAAPKLQAKFNKLVSYCRDDVSAEEGVLTRVPPWPAMPPWDRMPAIDREINDRGILIDVQLVQGLAKAAQVETARLDKEIHTLSHGKIPAVTNVSALKQYLLDRGVKLPVVDEDKDDEDKNPEAIYNEDDKDPDEGKKDVRYRLRKADLVDLIAEGNLPEDCYRAVDIRLEAAKASAKKLTKILAMTGADGRLRDALALMGAQQTGRWSSPGVQAHNTVRDCIGNPDEVAEQNGLDPKKDKEKVRILCDSAIRTAVEVGRTGDPDLISAIFTMTRKDNKGRLRTDGVLPFVSRMTRRTMAARKGKVFLNGDFANIEARIPVWLAGQEDMVQAYREGKDVYRLTAAPIYGLTPEELSKQQRQVGKVVVLACGFAGGVGAFVPMALNYGLAIPREEAWPIVKKFRDSQPFLTSFWDMNLFAAINAVSRPGAEFAVPPKQLISWFMVPGSNVLCCRLPSGRLLRYWAPRLQKGYWTDYKTGKLVEKPVPDLTTLVMKGNVAVRRTLWRGLAIENVVQAIAADLLANSIVNMHDAGLPVVLHVHDNDVAEVDEDKAELLLPVFNQCMLSTPSWTQGLPIAIDSDISTRFG